MKSFDLTTPLNEEQSGHMLYLKAHKSLPRWRSSADDISVVAAPVSDVSPQETIPFSSLYTSLDANTLLGTGNGYSTLPPTPPSNFPESMEREPLPGPRRLGSNAISRRLRNSPVTTPVHQRSPPTPQTTPPGAGESLDILRSPTLRYPSSRADSFMTARENQWSSDEEGSRKWFPVHEAANRSLSDMSVAEVPSEHPDARPWRRLDEITAPVDSKMSSSSDWTGRYVTVGTASRTQIKTPPKNTQSRSSKPPRLSFEKGQSARESVDTCSCSPRARSLERIAQDLGWPSEVNDKLHGHLRDRDPKRHSGISTASTVVEAVVVSTPRQKPRTLRHVSKNLALRAAADSLSTSRRTHRDSYHSDEAPRHRLMHKNVRIPERRQRDSAGSDFSMNLDSPANSSFSQRSREEAIPVLVIPQRRSSLTAATTSLGDHQRAQSLTRTPQSRPSTAPEFMTPTLSLQLDRRKTSSHRSSQSNVWHDAAESAYHLTGPEAGHERSRQPKNAGVTSRIYENLPHPDGRAEAIRPQDGTPPGALGQHHLWDIASRSDDRKQPSQHQLQIKETLTSGEVTISQPGIVARPISAEGPFDQSPEEVTRAEAGRRTSELRPNFERSSTRATDESRRVSIDRSTVRTEEHAMARFVYSQVTPFSQFSGTPDALEVSEATAVSIYPHHNNSLLVVQQAARPVLQRSGRGLSSPPEPMQPSLAVVPSTPPMDNRHTAFVDSPLKNPRRPPEPPAFKIIPPTPAEELERELGSRKTAGQDDSTPSRRSSLAQRARRYSDTIIQPLFSRTNNSTRRSQPVHRAPSVAEQQDNKLHPFWRPRGFWDDLTDSDDESFFDESRTSQSAQSSKVMERRRSAVASPDSRGGFLIGNSLGVTRAGTNVRRHHVSLPAALLARRSRAHNHANDNVPSQKRPRSATVRTRRRSTSPMKMASRPYKIPGLGLQLQYVGLRGMREKMRERHQKQEERRREEEREKLRRRIGTRFVVESGRMI